MKTRILWTSLCWLLLLSSGARAQNLTVQETFEGLGTDFGYTANTFNVSAIEYFERRAFTAVTGGTGYTGTTQGLNNREGSFTWTGEGVRGTGQTNVRSAGAVVLNPITNSANYKNFVITVAMAAPRGGTFTGAGSNSAYPADRIRVQYSFNGGAWTTAAMLMGNNALTPGTLGNGGDLQQLTTLADSTSVAAGNSPTGGGTVLDQTYRDITATLPATALGSNLRVRVVLDIKLVEVAFDNIRVTGTLDNAARPTLTGIEPAVASYTEGGSPVQLTNALQVGYSDNSATTLTGGTVATGGFVSGQDVLNFTNQNGISGSYGAGTGVLTLSGSASQAAYQAALRSITYSNSNTTTATGGTRSFTFQVFNGATLSTTASRNLVVTAALNAPAALNYTENFDADGEGTRYFGNPFVSTSTQTGFFRATTSPATFGGNPIGQGNFTGWSGGYWFGEGNDNTNNPGAPTSTLQLAPVNATGRVNLKFTVALGAAGNWLGYFNPDNPGDSFELFYRLNGGTPVKFGAFYGVDGATPARQDSDLDRLTPATGTQLSAALQDFTFDLPAAAAVGNLDFLLVQGARGQSEIAFDNIRITGTALPTVTTTTPATNITATSATLGGTVTADGGGTLTERGVVYVVGTGTPTTSDTKAVVATSGIVVGTAFSGTVSGLTAGTQYTARAYAINEAGTSYGANVTFTTLTPTTVISLVRTSPVAALTNATSVVYTVTFGAAVTGLTTSNFDLVAPTLTGAGIGAVAAGAGNTYTVTVNTGTGNGDLTLRLVNATNTLPGITTALPFAGETYTLDKTAPTVSAVAVPANGSYKAGDVLSFTVNFSEAVAVTGTPQLGLALGATSRQAHYVSGSGSTALIFSYAVQAGDDDADGITLASALTLNGGTLTDAAGNVATLTLNGVPPTTGILVDTTVPTVTLSSPVADGGSTTTSPVSFTAQFSESVGSTFTSAGITVSGGSAVSNFAAGSAANSYTFDVTPAVGPGSVSIAAGVAQDAAGNGNAASATFRFTYQAPPTISSVSPSSGVVGTSVTLTGTNLSGATSVSFNGTDQTTITGNTATQLTARVPLGASTGNVTVTTHGGISNGLPFTVVPTPALSSLSPTSGPVGTSVTLTGTGLTGASAVSFNGTAAVTFAVVNATAVTATVPAGATSGDVTVTTPGGTSNALAFTVTHAPVATAQGVSTAEDVATAITLAATDADGDALTFAIATPPAHGTLSGTGSTRIYKPALNYNGPDAFTFTASDRALTSVPATVSLTVTPVNDAPVLANVPPAASIAKQVPYTFTATATDADGDPLTFSLVSPPAGAVLNPSTGVFTWTPTAPQAGSTYTFSVRVSDGMLTDTQPVALTVLKGTTSSAAPTLTSFSPAAGPIGSSVTLTGTNLAGTRAVSFNGVAAAFAVQSATSVTTTVPAGATSGKVSLTTADGTAQSADNFTVITKPVITRFSPTSGPVGTLVTIYGYNLLAPSKVTIGGKAAAITPSQSTATQLVATVPAGAKTGVIGVTTATGPATSADLFTVTATAAAANSLAIEAVAVLEQPLQAAPNPFQGRVLLRFALAQEQAYTLRVYDVRGALLQELGTGTAKEGEARELEWDGHLLAEGLYLVRLTTATGTQTLRLVRQL